jgi:hypothetical protein
VGNTFFHFSKSAISRTTIASTTLILLFIIPTFRHAVFFNLAPLCMIGLAIVIVHRFIASELAKKTLTILVVGSLFLHAYNCYLFGVNFAFDSKEYWSLAQGFATGHGLGGLMYRPPLYPVLAGLFVVLGDHTGLFIVLFQHAILVACIPASYLVGRMFRFSRQASCIAAAFVTLNSLLMQAAGFIMTEIVFLALVLASVAILKRLYDKPSILLSILSGVMFAGATYCRQLLFPVLLGGLALIALKKGKQGIVFGCIALATYFAAIAPWCLRNFKISGQYAMSANFGAVAFTKASTFDCLDGQGKNFKQLEKPLENVLVDLNLTGLKTPAIPEDDWQVNRIPHALIDSLKTYHGFSYAQAGKLLGKAAMEGFIRHPLRYMSSVGNSFSALLFEHRDMYPDIKDIAPIDASNMYKLFARMLRGMVYVSGYVFLLFPIALVFRGNKKGGLLMPFWVVILMYGATAAIQIGLTRYTLPWEPLKALCAAYVVETMFLLGKLRNKGEKAG